MVKLGAVRIRRAEISMFLEINSEIALSLSHFLLLQNFCSFLYRNVNKFHLRCFP
jgi:hypothetical protein